MGSYSYSEDPSSDEVIEKSGCLIFIIATVLYAVQRYLLFSFLGYSASLGNSTAWIIHDFLFGEYPYSIFDILLGFEMPDEGLFFLLQPRNWALGLAQAFHYLINFGIAYIPVWLVSKISNLSSPKKWLGYSGCLALVVIPILFVVSLGSWVPEQRDSGRGVESTQDSQVIDDHYSNSEFGIHFDYPAFLNVQADSTRDRAPGGEIVTIITIAATSGDPVVGIILRSVEDPLRNVMFPNLYPPDETTLKILIIGELNALEYDDTEKNKSAMMSASDNAHILNISGHDAAAYRVGMDSSDYGHMYIRGALVITERRDISIYIMGSDEPGIRGSIEEEYIDTIWSTLISSLRIDY